MTLSEKDIRDIAVYVRIGLTDEEVTQMTSDLNEIIGTLEPITHMDLEGVEPTFHPIGGLSNVMREDEIGTPFPREVALENGDTVQDGCFEIPSILGGEAGDR